MAQVISLVAPLKAMTPSHSLMEVDDYEAASAATADRSDSLSPRMSSSSLARKRAASINTGDGYFTRLSHLRINTPSANMNADSSRDLICLCTPAPKIPRPRNAFILYRQHHQAQVVAQNPQLSNPDISKIIGEKWKKEPEDVQNTWKSLADEEKQRHQRQYPDYRYQPRRGTKAGSARQGSLPAEDSGRCPKCNGRSIATPRTPSTPLSTPTAAKPGTNPYFPGMQSEEAEVGRRGSFGGMPTRSRFPPPRPAHREMEDFEYESPELKRRRYNTSGSYHMVSSPHPPPDAYGAKAPPLSLRNSSIGSMQQGMRQYGGHPLPEPGTIPRSRSGPMPPPPRPPMGGPWGDLAHHHTGGRHASFDESLRLPPLQTSMPMSPSVANEVDVRHIGTPVAGQGSIIARDPQARSIEAMVMSIPFTKKLTVLSKINPPLAPAHAGSPNIGDTRGAVISVEGPKPRLLRQVGQAVERALAASDGIALRAWENHSTRDLEVERGDRESTPAEAHSFFTTYFQTMLKWHHKSQEISKYITTRVDVDVTANTGGEDGDELMRRDSAGSVDSRATSETKEVRPRQKIPVALLKEGFSLTLSDEWACTTPIADFYTPVDHWQWMATLWRGIIGPDLVVYVKPSIDDEIAKFGTVQFQPQPGLIIVRVPVGKDLDEATERRLAFEVIEWMRGGSFREESRV